MKIKTVFFFLSTSLTSLCSLGQNAPDPANDNGWILTTEMSDEFNYEYSSSDVIDPTKWDDDDGGVSAKKHNCFSGDPNHVEIVNPGTYGFLRLSATATANTCDGHALNYTVGQLNGNFGQEYGYFEVRARIPDVPSSGNHTGISANIWMFREAPWNNQWSEIDLAEIDCKTNRHTCNVIWDPHETSYWNGGPPAHTYVHGVDGEMINNKWKSWSKSSMRCPTFWYNSTFTNECDAPGTTYSPPDFNMTSGGWHTYGMLWTLDEIIIYFDGVEINRTSLGCPGIEAQKWIINPSVGDQAINISNQFGKFADASTIFPYGMDIDYIRTYQLDMDCNTVVDDCSFWFGGYDEAVKKSIRIGYGGCGNAQPASTDLHLRATDYIEIYGDFTVPLGAEMTAEIESCY